MRAPASIDFGPANVFPTKLGRHPEQSASLAESFGLCRRFAIREMMVDRDASVRLAFVTRLSSYDASYLWLGCDLGIELIILDKRLAADFAQVPP